MTKVLVFKVWVDGLEDKIWREIEITDRRTVADLAYSILASFESLAYHLYNIKHKKKIYKCGLLDDFPFGQIPLFAEEVRLKELDLKSGDILEMEYDFGLSFMFRIKYLGEKDFQKGAGNRYPKVMAGAGRGMMDDVTNEELKDIVKDIDKTGESVYQRISPETGKLVNYDYRVFSLELNDLMERDRFRRIKAGYEVEE